MRTVEHKCFRIWKSQNFQVSASPLHGLVLQTDKEPFVVVSAVIPFSNRPWLRSVCRPRGRYRVLPLPLFVSAMGNEEIQSACFGCFGINA